MRLERWAEIGDAPWPHSTSRGAGETDRLGGGTLAASGKYFLTKDLTASAPAIVIGERGRLRSICGGHNLNW